MFEGYEKRGRIQRVLSRLNAVFLKAAAARGLECDPARGPGVSRSIRFNDELERGVFLELKEPWQDANPENPVVVMSYGARYQSSPTGFPLYVFFEKFFEGAVCDLLEDQESLKGMLDRALNDVAQIAEDDVVTRGTCYRSLKDIGRSHA